MTDQPTPYQARRAERERTKQIRKQLEEAAGFVPPPMSDALRRERRLEQTRRNVEARRRALAVLAERYPDAFAELLAVEREGILREKGPLPGDHPADHAETLRVTG